MSFSNIAIVLIIIIGSVILHELAHGVVAYWLGDHTAKDMGRLTFNPIKHIDPVMSIIVPVVLYIIGAPVFGGAKPVPINTRNIKWREWGLCLVAAAGPFSNFLVALVSFLIGHFTGFLYGSSGAVLEFIFSELVFINIGFMIFNLIPVPPLDGSRILYAISPDGFRKVLTAIEPYGFIIVYLLIFLFGEVFSHLMVGGMNAILNFFYWIVGGY